MRKFKLEETRTFLDNLEVEVNEELSPIKNFIRESRLIKRVERVVRENYDYIFDHIIRLPENIKISRPKVIDDLSVSICNYQPELLLHIEESNFSDIELIEFLNKKSRIGYYESGS